MRRWWAAGLWPGLEGLELVVGVGDRRPSLPFSLKVEENGLCL